MVDDHGIYISDISTQKRQLSGYNCQLTRHIYIEPAEKDCEYDLYVQCL